VAERFNHASIASSAADFQFSGWVTSTYSAPGLLSLLVPNMFEGHLYFATRMAGGASNDFGWAAFRDVRLTLLGKMDDAGAIDPGHAEQVSQKRSQAEESQHFPKDKVRNVVNVLSVLLGDSPAVAYDDEREAIFCHPPQIGITIALVRDLEVWGRQILTCEASIESQRSLPVEFAMIATKLPLQEVIAACSGMGAPTSLDEIAFSGWHRVSSKKAQALMLGLERFEDDLVHVYFATRMPEGTDNNHYAWAYFNNIRVSRATDLSSEAAE
jgi:hypothetical protein